MGLYDKWKEIAEADRSEKEQDAFWREYLEKEKDNYQHILENKLSKLEGTIDNLAAEYKMEPAVFAGFLDGINTSLVTQLDIESLEADSVISAEIDFEKLYWNMLDVKAEWLYTLDEWDLILSQERRDEITREFRRSKMAVSNKIGRNDPCPCGSGKKYKKCCGMN